MTGIVFGYLRESNDDGMDPEGQRRDILALAERYGYDPDAVTWVNDFGYSGRNAKRPGWVRMQDSVTDGNVAAILARSVDRLGRDASEVIAFEGLCLTHGTRVITERDGERIASDEVNTFQQWVPALVAQEESRLGRLRARKARSTRIRHMEEHHSTCTLGSTCPDPLHHDGVGGYGTRPGEDLQAVLDAFREAGGYNGATRLLNDRGVAPRRGQRWDSTSVGRIVARHAERLDVRLPKRSHKGRRTLSTHTFSGLLRCAHDGSVLTGTNRTERSGPGVAYFCREGRTSVIRCPEHGLPVARCEDWTWACPAGHNLDRNAVTSDHPKPWSVSERVILDWAQAETKWVLGKQVIRVSNTNADELGRLKMKRDRLTKAWLALDISDEDHGRMKASLDDDIARLTGATEAHSRQTLGIDWTQAPDVLNARLRDLWSSVRLGLDVRPLGAVWLREPVTGEQDEWGSDVPDPDAIATPDGWYLEDPTPDPVRHYVGDEDEVESGIEEVAK